MATWVEFLFNGLWVSLIIVGVIITVVILKRRDPFDDGPSIEEEDDLYEADKPQRLHE